MTPWWVFQISHWNVRSVLHNSPACACICYSVSEKSNWQLFHCLVCFPPRLEPPVFPRFDPRQWFLTLKFNRLKSRVKINIFWFHHLSFSLFNRPIQYQDLFWLAFLTRNSYLEWYLRNADPHIWGLTFWMQNVHHTRAHQNKRGSSLSNLNDQDRKVNVRNRSVRALQAETTSSCILILANFFHFSQIFLWGTQGLRWLLFLSQAFVDKYCQCLAELLFERKVLDESHFTADAQLAHTAFLSSAG